MKPAQKQNRDQSQSEDFAFDHFIKKDALSAIQRETDLIVSQIVNSSLKSDEIASE